MGQGCEPWESKDALDALEKEKLTQAGSTLANLVRLEIYLDDIYFARSALLNSCALGWDRIRP